VTGRALARAPSAPAPAASGRSRDGPPPGLQTWLALSLAAAAVAATGAAVYLTAVSRHAPNPVGHATLSVVVCLSFAGAGLVALRRPPYVRFGVLLVGVGLSSLLGALHDANGAVVYTIGVLTSNLVFAVLVHALLAFPGGRLASRRNRLLALAAYLDVLALQALAVLFDPLTRWHSDHPRNLALVDSRAALSTGLEELEAGVAIALALGVAVVLFRRARSKTAVARRHLAPVLWGGSGGLLIFAVGLALAPLSSGAAVVGIGLGLLASLALPAAFLGVMVQGRLARAAVGELLVELRERAEPPGLRDALRRALGDPSLELARVRPEDGAYVDRLGGIVALPGPGEAQVATPILHGGEPIGALVHDRSLRLRPELLEAVSAAAGFALANEQALETVERVEGRNRALLDAIPDLMFRVARDGTYLDVRADDPSGLLRPPEELVGSNVRDVLPPAAAGAVLACVERALDGNTMSSVEYELTIDGVPRCFESRMVPSGDGEVVTIVRDFTEKRRADVELRRLVEEQAALRRVATLVAGEAAPEQVFQTVTGEACELLGLRSALLLRFDGPETATVVGKFGEPSGAFTLGSLLPLEEGAALTVLRTGAPARVDYGRLRGGIARSMRELGFSSSVGVPISVAGTTWGALIAGLRAGEVLPRETERRLQAFAELVALAVASAHARDELAASRLRIVEASDAERRRIERNLHDGAQQRLVALSVGLRLARARIRAAPEEAEELLGVATQELGEALTELRELAQGIHPAVLAERGLPAALEVLAARTPLPVALDVSLPERLPEPVEAAAYYVVSEALANVVKHARAGSAAVRVGWQNGCALVEVEDDGAGGAGLDGGSGLGGLRDRVETLDGRLVVESAPGRGTVVRAELPLP
jgi:signal transduction histidine kinase/PAS domain-containing protein